MRIAYLQKKIYRTYRWTQIGTAERNAQQRRSRTCAGWAANGLIVVTLSATANATIECSIEQGATYASTNSLSPGRRAAPRRTAGWVCSITSLTAADNEMFTPRPPWPRYFDRRRALISAARSLARCRCSSPTDCNA